VKELCITVLGTPGVTLGDEPVTGFVSSKAQALVYYLAATGRAHTRETLAGLLWSDKPDTAARSNLRNALSSLRGLIGPYLLITRQTVALNREAVYAVDSERFAEIAFSTRRGAALSAEDLAALRTAVDLYQGEFLAGFYAPDAPLFEEWVLNERESQRLALEEALEKLVHGHSVRGEYKLAIAFAQRWLSADPLRESAHRSLIALYAWSGDRSSAMRQYEICAQVLEKELGVKPSTETTELYDHVRAGELEAGVAAGYLETGADAFGKRVPARGEYGRSAGEALLALVELMQVPQARAVMMAFRADFEDATDHIDVLSSYKRLHDLLHALQFHCYNPIVQEAMRFPGDDVAADNLTDHELTLQRIINDLQEDTERAPFATTEGLWIRDLVKAREALREALEALNPKPLKRAIWLLNRVLAVQPSRINTRLNATARALRLPVLAETMARVRDNLASLDLNPHKLGQFGAGVEALARLSHTLTVLVDEHDRWQAVELELQRIDGIMGQGTMELEMSWPDLKAMTEPLYGGRSDAWATSFKTGSEHLDSAIDGENTAQIRHCFRRYRRETSTRFHRVDVELNRLCEDLRRAGEPLASVIRMIA
jgi:DNA-binding SARP family transcriptional activator